MEEVEQWRKIKSFCSGVFFPDILSRCLLTLTSIRKVFVFLAWVENYFLTRPSNNMNLTSFWLKPYLWECFFPRFFFLFVHSFPRRSLSVRFGARSQICGDSRTVRFSRLLCGLVKVLQKGESSVKGLLSTFYTGEVLQLCWSLGNYKDHPEVRCCLLWHAFILSVTLRVRHIDKFLCWRFLSYKRYRTRLDIIVGTCL